MNQNQGWDPETSNLLVSATNFGNFHFGPRGHFYNASSQTWKNMWLPHVNLRFQISGCSQKQTKRTFSVPGLWNKPEGYPSKAGTLVKKEEFCTWQLESCRMWYVFFFVLSLSLHRWAFSLSYQCFGIWGVFSSYIINDNHWHQQKKLHHCLTNHRALGT